MRLFIPFANRDNFLNKQGGNQWIKEQSTAR